VSLFEVESNYDVCHLCTKNINSIFSRVINGPTSAHFMDFKRYFLLQPL
jgi:hypothetical protein